MSIFLIVENMGIIGRIYARMERSVRYFRGLVRSGSFGSCGKGLRLGRIDFFHGEKYISIGESVAFDCGISLAAWNFGYGIPSITIGNGCNFGAYNHITSVGEIVIGDGVLTGKWVTITDNSHGKIDFQELQIPPSEREVVFCGKVVIGPRVWIGDKVTILPGVEIGEGCVIGANSVVTKSIPPFSVAVGNPARILSKRW